MAVLHQFDYIFAFGLIFAFLDAWNIGANDVANSFATSVSSRSLSLREAMCIATVAEFAGAIGVGARVADTIRTKVINPALYEDDAAVLMLAMTCALVGSSVYLTFATKWGLPVSTTHSIMGGVIGVGVASIGAGRVNWGWKGVSQVFAAWAIAPGLAGAFGAIIFLFTKYGVMRRRNPVKAAFIAVPIYFAITSSLLTMLIVWKGAAARAEPSTAVILGSIFGAAGGVALLVIVFFLPFLHRKLVLGDWTLKPYHIIFGPLLLRRGDVPPHPDGVEEVQDYYRGYATQDELRAAEVTDTEKTPGVVARSDVSSDNVEPRNQTHEEIDVAGARPEGPVYSPVVLWYYFKKGFFHGVDQDVVSAQKKRNILSGDLEGIHARAAHYDNKAEYTYSFLQVMTAAVSSFTHGANDVSNAVGPLATIFLIWDTGVIEKKTPIPYWVLAFGGAGIIIGLWTYGYNIMRNLGNRITLHSPSRGFSMELGSAVTVIMATRLALPISTTQCITGATVGVGLCNGDWRTINWRMVAWIYFGWLITLPVTGIIAGCLMGIILNAPQWGNSV